MKKETQASSVKVLVLLVDATMSEAQGSQEFFLTSIDRTEGEEKTEEVMIGHDGHEA